MNHPSPLALVKAPLPILAISYHGAQVQIRRWLSQSQSFSVDVIVKPEGAIIQFTNSFHRFELCDGLGRCKLFKAIPALHQRLNKLVPYSHRDCIHFEAH